VILGDLPCLRELLGGAVAVIHNRPDKELIFWAEPTRGAALLF
jgi:hypothetical protein